MHSKRRYEICTSVILGELESFRTINKGFNQLFFDNIRCNCFDNFLHHILNPKILPSFSFFFENSLTCGVKCEKLNFEKWYKEILFG